MKESDWKGIISHATVLNRLIQMGPSWILLINMPTLRGKEKLRQKLQVGDEAGDTKVKWKSLLNNVHLITCLPCSLFSTCSVVRPAGNPEISTEWCIIMYYIPPSLQTPSPASMALFITMSTNHSLCTQLKTSLELPPVTWKLNMHDPWTFQFGSKIFWHSKKRKDYTQNATITGVSKMFGSQHCSRQDTPCSP